jgi:hypothetical protein
VTAVANDNAAATKSTAEKKAEVTTARVEQAAGEVHHRQWVLKNRQQNWA